MYFPFLRHHSGTGLSQKCKQTRARLQCSVAPAEIGANGALEAVILDPNWLDDDIKLDHARSSPANHQTPGVAPGMPVLN